MKNVCRINGKDKFSTSTFFGFNGLAKFDPMYSIEIDNSPAAYLYRNRNENIMFLIRRTLLRSIK